MIDFLKNPEQYILVSKSSSSGSLPSDHAQASDCPPPPSDSPELDVPVSGVDGEQVQESPNIQQAEDIQTIPERLMQSYMMVFRLKPCTEVYLGGIYRMASGKYQPDTKFTSQWTALLRRSDQLVGVDMLQFATNFSAMRTNTSCSGNPATSFFCASGT